MAAKFHLVTPDTDLGGALKHSGGEPPTIEPMEKRLSEVEKAIIRLDGRFDTMAARMDSMNDKLDRVVTEVKTWKWQIFAAAIAVALSVWGSSIAIQQMTVSSFQGAAQAAAEARGSLQPQQPTVIVVPGPYAAPQASAPR